MFLAILGGFQPTDFPINQPLVVQGTGELGELGLRPLRAGPPQGSAIEKTYLKLIDFGLSKRFSPGQSAATKAVPGGLGRTEAVRDMRATRVPHGATLRGDHVGGCGIDWQGSIFERLH